MVLTLCLCAAYGFHNKQRLLLYTAITLRTASFNTQKFLMVFTWLLCAAYGSHNKQRLLPYTALEDRFCITEVECSQRGTD